MYSAPAYIYQQGTTAQGEPIMVPITRLPGGHYREPCQYCGAMLVREITNLVPVMCLIVIVMATFPLGMIYAFLLINRINKYWCANCNRDQENLNRSPTFFYVLGTLLIVCWVVVFVFLIFIKPQLD